MGMIEGAIIGGAIGVAVSVAMLLKRGASKKKLIAALGSGEGREEARALLDKSLPPTKKIGLSKILDQRERMAGLALLDDVTTLEAEIAEHYGPLTAEVQVNAMGLLALAVRARKGRAEGEVVEGACQDDVRSEPAPAAQQLDTLAARLEEEGGRTLHLVKKSVRAMAHLAAGVAGTPIPVEQLMNIERLASDGGMVQLLIWQALSMALARAGKEPQAENFRNKVRQQTRAFDSSAAGAPPSPPPAEASAPRPSPPSEEE